MTPPVPRGAVGPRVVAGVCDHEGAVVTAVLRGRWPDGCDDALGAHVNACEACRDVVEIVRVLGDDPIRLRRDVRVPAAGQVWWRAAVRARLEATDAAARPLLWLQATVATLLVGGSVIAGSVAIEPVSATVGRASRWLGAWAPLASASMDATATSGPAFWLAAGLAVCLVATPVAVYLAVHDE